MERALRMLATIITVWGADSKGGFLPEALNPHPLKNEIVLGIIMKHGAPRHRIFSPTE